MSAFVYSLRPLSRVSTIAVAVVLYAVEAQAQSSQPLSPVTIEAPRVRPRAALAPQPTVTRQVTRRVDRRAIRPPAPRVTPVPITPPSAATAAISSPIDRDPAGGGLDPNGLNLTKIAPTGSRLGLTPFETPASVEIIPGQLARDRGQRTVQEAVTQDATGFTFIGNPGNGGTSLSVRGFTNTGSVQQIFDGTRLYVGSGTVTFPYDTWSAERIEVLRGPASVLYGEGAIGGVVNVVPKKPTPFFTHEAFAAVGTDLSRRFGVGSGGPINDVLQYRIDVAGNAAKSWLSDNNDYRNFDFTGSVKFEPSANFTTTVLADYSVNHPIRNFGEPLINFAAPRINGGTLSPALRFVNYDVGNGLLKFQDSFTQVKTEWSPIPGVTFRNVAYRETAIRHFRDADQFAFAPLTQLVNRPRYFEVYHNEEQIGDRLDMTGLMTIGTWKNKILVGGEVNDIRFRLAGNTPFTAPVPNATDLSNALPNIFASPQATRLSFTTHSKTGVLFAENQLSPTNWISFIAGGRYDASKVHREDYTDNSEFDKQFNYATWHLGTVITPLPWLSLYTQYATGVDSVGNIISLALNQSQFQLARGRQIEAGAKVTAFDGRFEGTLAFYQIIKKDLLTPDPNNSSVLQQVGAQSSRGVELSASLWAIPEILRFDLNAAILRAKYDDFRQALVQQGFNGRIVNYRGFVPVDVPQQVANAWATWRFAPRWEARAGLQYVGKTYGDSINQSVRSRYAVVNASLDYKPTDFVKFSIRGFNLADAAYAITGRTQASVILGQPRRFEFAMNIRY